jgi:hypothetical protein
MDRLVAVRLRQVLARGTERSEVVVDAAGVDAVPAIDACRLPAPVAAGRSSVWSGKLASNSCLKPGKAALCQLSYSRGELQFWAGGR